MKAKLTIGLMAALALTLFAGQRRRAMIVDARRAVTATAASDSLEGNRQLGAMVLVSLPPTARSEENKPLSPYVGDLQKLLTETDDARRSDEIDKFVEGLAAVEIPTVLGEIVSTGGAGGSELRQLLIRRWADSDHTGAAAWAAQLATTPLRTEAFNQISLAWSETDLAGAIQWARTLPADSRSAVLLQLGYEAARTDPLGALQIAIEVAAGSERNQLVLHTTSQWADTDPQSAMNWATTIQDAAMRDQVLAVIAAAMAGHDAPTAATLATSALPAGPEQDRAVVSIVQRWAQTDPQAAAAWVATCADTPACDTTVNNLVAIWSQRESSAAATWLEELPNGHLRDTGLAALAQQIAPLDPAAAQAWTSLISDRSIQQSAQESVAQVSP